MKSRKNNREELLFAYVKGNNIKDLSKIPVKLEDFYLRDSNNIPLYLWIIKGANQPILNYFYNAVRIFYPDKYKIFQRDNTGKTILHWACMLNLPMPSLKILIARTTNTFINLTDDSGATFLYRAVQAGHIDVVRELISHGADINLADNNGVTPLNLAAEYGHVEIIDLLFKHGATVADVDGITPLHSAAYMNKLNSVNRLLSQHNFDINSKTNSGMTALHYAARNGHIEIVKELLKHNADMTATNSDGKTALDFAIQNQRIDIVTELVFKMNITEDNIQKQLDDLNTSIQDNLKKDKIISALADEIIHQTRKMPSSNAMKILEIVNQHVLFQKSPHKNHFFTSTKSGAKKIHAEMKVMQKNILKTSQNFKR